MMVGAEKIKWKAPGDGFVIKVSDNNSVNIYCNDKGGGVEGVTTKEASFEWQIMHNKR